METLLAVAIYYVMVVTVFSWLFRALENLLDIQRKRPQTLNEHECETLRQNLKPPVQTQKRRPPAATRRRWICTPSKNPGASTTC
jgi:polar amino acid transport system permease protein